MLVTFEHRVIAFFLADVNGQSESWEVNHFLIGLTMSQSMYSAKPKRSLQYAKKEAEQSF